MMRLRRKNRLKPVGRPKVLRLRAVLRSLAALPTLDQMDYILVEEAMRRHWSKTQAAAALGISREGLRKKMNRLRLNWWQQS